MSLNKIKYEVGDTVIATIKNRFKKNRKLLPSFIIAIVIYPSGDFVSIKNYESTIYRRYQIKRCKSLLLERL